MHVRGVLMNIMHICLRGALCKHGGINIALHQQLIHNAARETKLLVLDVGERKKDIALQSLANPLFLLLFLLLCASRTPLFITEAQRKIIML
jgi:hypothetical protein